MLKIIASNLFFRIVAILIQVLLLIITNRLLLAEGRGIVASAMTWANTFYILFYCSLNIILFNSINENPDKKESYIKGLYSFSFILAILALAASYISFFLFPNIFKNIPSEVLFLNFLAIPFIVIQNNLWSIFQARQQFKYFNMVIVITPLTNLIACLLLIWFNNFTVVTSSVALLISWAAGAGYCMYKMQILFSFKSITIFNSSSIRTKILFAHLATLITFLISRVDILFLNYYTNNQLTGAYFMASAAVGYLLILPLGVQSVLYSKLIGLSQQEEKKMIITYSKLTFSVMVAICIFIEIFAGTIMSILGGKAFDSSIFYLRLLAPTAVIFSIPVIWASLWISKGYFKKLSIISLVAMLISLIMNYLLIPVYGAVGAAVTYFSCCSFIFVFYFFMIKTYLTTTNPLNAFLLTKQDLMIFYAKAITFIKSNKHIFF